MENFLLNIRKFILSKILGRKYYRTGKCKACGKCCTKIYVKHYKHVIQDEEEFKKLQYLHRFYTYLKVIDKDETGLVFECQNLDPVTHKCKIHKSRPGICRRYPQEELFSMGGALSEDCGYKMLPIVSFDEVLKKASKKNSKKKKFFFIILIVLFGQSVFAENGFSDKFINKFRTCSIYAETNDLNNQGTVFHDLKFIFKDYDGKCSYTQIVTTSYGSLKVNCKFDEQQVFNLYNTMAVFNRKHIYDPTAENLWNTYVNNPDVCVMTQKQVLQGGGSPVPPQYLPWN